MFAAVILAGPALAESFQDKIIAQLGQQGFSRVVISKTLLGRVRITATSLTHRREIIFNPRTGEILRDYWEVIGGAPDLPRISDPNPQPDGAGGGGSHGGDDDNDDDNDDDDDGDDDEEDDDDGDDDGDDD